MKQLGKPTGIVPPVHTQSEYEERERMRAGTEATAAEPPTEPVITEPQPQPLLSHGVWHSPSKIIAVSEPNPSPGLSVEHADARGQDVDMGIQWPDDHLLSRPPSARIIEVSDDEQASVGPVTDTIEITDDEEPATVDPGMDIIEISDDDELANVDPLTNVIEITDDEDVAAVGPETNAAEPMEVDEDFGTGGATRQSSSGLVPDGIVTKSPSDIDLPERGSTTQPMERTLQNDRPRVEVLPLPDHAHQNKGKKRVLTQQEDDEGLYRVSVLWLHF